METVSGYTVLSVWLGFPKCALLEIATVHSERFKLALVPAYWPWCLEKHSNIQGQSGLSLFIPKFEAWKSMIHWNLHQSTPVMYHEVLSTTLLIQLGTVYTYCMNDQLVWVIQGCNPFSPKAVKTSSFVNFTLSNDERFYSSRESHWGRTLGLTGPTVSAHLSSLTLSQWL